MNTARHPWMKFYPSDWRADQALRICSIAARGLWVELMCIMHEAEPYGHLVVNGVPLTEMQIAMLTGIPSVEIGALLTELETAGVFSKNRDGIIYSRRMTRDERKRSDGKKTAKQGTLTTSRRGKQVAEKQKENLPPPGVVRGVVRQPPPHPEARGQRPDIYKRSPKGDPKVDREKTDVAAGAKRATRLPECWQPSEKDREYAVSEGFCDELIDQEAEKFRAHHLAKGKRNADWHAAWRYWVLSSFKHPKRNGNQQLEEGSANGRYHQISGQSDRRKTQRDRHQAFFAGAARLRNRG